MQVMKEPGHDAIGMLRWGIRRYRWLFLVCLLLGAAAAPYAASKLERPAEAEALVLAQQWNQSLTALPRYGETIFDNGKVAQAVALKIRDGVEFGDVVPDHVSLIADQDSIVFRVVGHDRDPQTAAEIANTAANEFVTALSASGAGVGTFTVLSQAETPPAPEGGGLSRALAIPVGLVAGAVLGLAVVSILLATRRPVIDAAGVEEATGVPGLGTVTVPRTRRGEFARPDQFPGLVPVCRRLLRLKTPAIVVVSRSSDQRHRGQLSVALAGVLMRVRPLRFTGPAALREAVTEQQAALHPDAFQYTSEENGVGGLTVIDSDDPLDLVQPPDLTAAVLVAREGITSAALRAAVVEHLGGSAEARVLLVKPGRRVRRGGQGRSAAAEAPPVEELSLRQ